MGFKKGEKITDEATLERLKIARQKAMDTRKKNADAKKDIKLAKELEDKKELQEAQEKIQQTIKPKIIDKSIEKEIPQHSNNENIVSRVKESFKKPKKKKEVIVVESDSSESSDSEPEVIIKRSKKSKIKNGKNYEKNENSQPPTYNDVLNNDKQFHKTYKSLFPEF